MNVGELNVELSMRDKDFTVTVTRAGAVVEQFTRNLKRTADGVERIESSMHGAGRTFRNFMITVASVRFALMDFDEVILGIPKGVTKVSGELERMEKLMEGLSTAADAAGRRMEAQKGFNYIINLAQRAPFEIKSITDAFVKLKAGGLDPMDGSLQALIDGVARFGGDSQTLHRAAVAIQQMAGKGVISMEELRQQLGEAMPNAMQAMARGMGVSVAELTKKISTGTVEAKTALRQMFTVMTVENAGAAERMMTTWSGLESQLKTQMHLIGKEIGDAGFFSEVKIAAKELLDALKSPDGRSFARGLGQDLAELVRISKDVVKGVWDMRNVILAAGTAIATVWGVSKIRSMLGGVQAEFTRHAAQQQAQAQQIAAAKIEGINRATAAEVAAARAAIARNVDKVARERLVYQQLFNVHAQHLAQIEALEARYRMNRAGRYQDMTTGRVVSTAQATAEAARLRQNAQAIDEMMKANQRARSELEDTNRTMQGSIVVMGQKAAEATKLAGVIGLATRATNLFKAGLGFLGGPIWGTITLLTLMIPVWSRWANAGEEAIKKVRDAMAAGTGTRQGRDLLEKELAAKREELAVEQAKLDEITERQRERGFKESDIAATVKPWADKVKALKSEVAQLQRDINETTRQALAGDAQSGADAALKSVNTEIDRITEQTNAKIADSVKARENALKVEGANAKAIWDAAGKREADIIKEAAQAQLNAIMAASARIDEELKKPTDTKKFQELMGAKKALDNLLASKRQDLQGLDLVGAGIKTAPGNKVEKEKSPLVQMLEKAKAEYENAQEKLEELEQGALTLEGLQERILNKLEAQARLGKLSYKDAAGNVVNVGPDNPILKEIAAIQAKGQAIDKLSAVMQRSLGAEAQLKEELAAANDRLSMGSEKFSGAYAKTLAEITKGNAGLIQGAEGWDKLTEAQRRALALAAQVDLTNITGQAVMRAKGVQHELLTTVEERVKAELKAVADAESAKFMLAAQSLFLVEGVNAETIAKIQFMWGQFAAALGTQLEVIARKNQSPMEKLLEQWNDTTQAMKELNAKWADSFIDEFTRGIMTGKFEWKKLLQSILEDIIKMQSRKAMGSSLNSFFEWAVGSIGSMFGAGGTTGDGIPLNQPYPYAMGGIHGPDGSVPLKKYANGGIANSPQMALFGEGSKPEAYVPLPDGRTIPVTIKGGGQAAMPNVVVNVINQTGTEAKAEQKGPRMDMGQMILDVVLTAASRPGPFRDGMKGAMG